MSERRPNDLLQDGVEIPYSHAQVTAGFVAKLWKAPRKFRLDSVDYLNPTGLAEDGTNYFAIGVANVSKALTFTSFTFTAATTDICTAAGHGLLTGDGPVQLTTSNTLPAGLSLATDYYIIKLSADTFSLATTRTNAYAGTAVDITGTGTGTHTLAGASAKRPLVLASYSTDSAGAGTNTLVANAFTSLALNSTDANLIVEAGEELAIYALEGGSATLPAGSGTIRGRLL